MSGLIGLSARATANVFQQSTGPASRRPAAEVRADEFQVLLTRLTRASKGGEVEATSSSGEQAATLASGMEAGAALQPGAQNGGSLADAAVDREAESSGNEAPLTGASEPLPVTLEVGGPQPGAADEVRRIDRDLKRLDPEFRQRLEQVIERMESEFGHSVAIVEGFRSQSRQDFLFEQGRTRAGQVVTWTRNSNHTQGRAVDVLIDGSYENAAGYQRLARIAAEEGLQTLGARDPGHLELPIGGGSASTQWAAMEPSDGPSRNAAARPAFLARPGIPHIATPAAVAHVAQVAEVARIARVAQVAPVATVAQAATVAQVARPPRVASMAPSAGSDAGPAPSPQLAAGVGAAHSGPYDWGSGASDSGEGLAGESAAPEAESFRAGSGSTANAPSRGALPAAAPAQGSEAVERAAQILAMKEGASPSSVNHLLLRLDRPVGGADRIRVDLRGGVVGTSLNIENPDEARWLGTRVDDLRKSLERAGLESESVRIRTTAAKTDGSEVGRTLLHLAESESVRHAAAPRSDAHANTERDGWKGARGERDRDADGSERRSPREQTHKEMA